MAVHRRKKSKDELLTEARVIDSELTDAEQEFAKFEGKLSSKLWKYGDWLRVYAPNYGSRNNVARLAKQDGVLTLKEVAAATGRPTKDLSVYRRVAGFYVQPETRRAGVPFTEHLLAMEASRGDMEEALRILSQYSDPESRTERNVSHRVARTSKFMLDPESRQKVIDKLRANDALDEVAKAMSEAAGHTNGKPSGPEPSDIDDDDEDEEELEDDVIGDVEDEEEEQVIEVPPKRRRVKAPDPVIPLGTRVLLMEANGAIRRLRERLDGEFRDDEDEDDMLDLIDRKLDDFRVQIDKAKRQVRMRRTNMRVVK